MTSGKDNVLQRIAESALAICLKRRGFFGVISLKDRALPRRIGSRPSSVGSGSSFDRARRKLARDRFVGRQ